MCFAHIEIALGSLFAEMDSQRPLQAIGFRATLQPACGSYLRCVGVPETVHMRSALCDSVGVDVRAALAGLRWNTA